MIERPSLKPLIWAGSSLNELREFPGPVQDHMGYALYVAQGGGKHRNHEDAERISQCGSSGSDNGLSRRHFSGGVHGPILVGGVRSLYLPEEIDDRPPDAAARDRID